MATAVASGHTIQHGAHVGQNYDLCTVDNLTEIIHETVKTEARSLNNGDIIYNRPVCFRILVCGDQYTARRTYFSCFFLHIFRLGRKSPESAPLSLVTVKKITYCSTYQPIQNMQPHLENIGQIPIKIIWKATDMPDLDTPDPVSSQGNGGLICHVRRWKLFLYQIPL